MVLCFTGKGGTDFNEVRYSDENTSDFIFNIPAGRMVLDKKKGCLTFKYAWLYMMSRSFEVPISSIIQCKLLNKEEIESHPFYVDSISCFSKLFKSRQRVVELKFTKGMIITQVTVRMKKYKQIIRNIENHTAQIPE